jgi:hypothetical protein
LKSIEINQKSMICYDLLITLTCCLELAHVASESRSLFLMRAALARCFVTVGGYKEEEEVDDDNDEFVIDAVRCCD